MPPATSFPSSDPTAAASALAARISACRLCAAEFAQTTTAHQPRPVVWFGSGARILIAGQAPGARVHQSGRPYSDPSGNRLRAWLGAGPELFYDRARVAIVPMAFCFPGYDPANADLPPPPRCAATWHREVMETLGPMRLALLVGGYAQRWHLGREATRGGVTDTVARWREFAPSVFPLPHPSWRNSAWLRRNPWFEADLVPALRRRVREVLEE